jgi:selenocysteine lyase/cysteine desulfurase
VIFLSINGISQDFQMIERYNYLSTASIGLVPELVIEKSKELFVELTTGGNLSLDEEKEVLVYESLRINGSKLLSCDKDNIGVFNSVTEALNTIAWSLDFDKGKIVSTSIEFPSVTYPWIRLSRKKGIDFELIEPQNNCISIEELYEKIDDQTKVVSISHVEFLTGQKFDLEELAKKVHEVGAFLIVDGIQAAGYTPLNVKKWNVDVYITGSYKWLCAPFGTSIAYISKDLFKLEPIFVGWRSTEDIWNFDATKIIYADTARKFEYSTSAYGAKYGLTQSIEYLQKIGIKNIQNHNEKLVNILLEELRLIPELEVISPPSRGSIVTFKLKKKGIEVVHEKLRQLERPVELTIRQGMMRISPHFYNNESDIYHFTNNLKKILINMG